MAKGWSNVEHTGLQTPGLWKRQDLQEWSIRTRKKCIVFLIENLKFYRLQIVTALLKGSLK